MSSPCLCSTWCGNDAGEMLRKLQLDMQCWALPAQEHWALQHTQDIPVATLLDQHSAPSKGLALHSAECWCITALLPPQGLSSVSSGSHSQDPGKAAATPPPCFVESLQGETETARPMTKCKNLVTLILMGFLGPTGSETRKHSAAVWSCSTSVLVQLSNIWQQLAPRAACFWSENFQYEIKESYRECWA